MDGHARANRQKPSGIAAKEMILRVHLLPALGHKRLDAIKSEDVQRLKRNLEAKSPKTVNNVLAVLSVLLKKAVEWEVIDAHAVHGEAPAGDARDRRGSTTSTSTNGSSKRRAVLDPRTHLIVLLGGEAGLRCGEMIALEWADVDLGNRQLCIRRSDWNGQVTTPKGGRLRHVPLTRRLAAALSEHRHLRSTRVLCQDDARAAHAADRADAGEASGRAQACCTVTEQRRRAHPPSHVLLAPGDAWRAGEGDSGARRARGPVDDAALHAPEPGGARRARSGCSSNRGPGTQRRPTRGRRKILETWWRRAGGVKTINKTGQETGGEAGIRTLGRALRPYNGLANRRLQPLGHLTARLASIRDSGQVPGRGPSVPELSQQPDLDFPEIDKRRRRQ